ncbi:methyltransferase-like protein 27 isoform X1 [Rhinoraja longicauda]
MNKDGVNVAAATKNLLTMYSEMDTEEKVNFYNSWAENYEKHMSVMDYQAPSHGVETINSVYSEDRSSALVFDVPCGTGMVADLMQKLGFKNFHGMDGSEEMLKISESKGMYQKLMHCLITADKQLPVKEGTYDVVMVVGGISQRHLPWEILPELLRITKTDTDIPSSESYRRAWEDELKQLIMQDIWDESLPHHTTTVSCHPSNGLFQMLRSGKRLRCHAVKTERMRRSFFPQAIRTVNFDNPRD